MDISTHVGIDVSNRTQNLDEIILIENEHRIMKAISENDVDTLRSFMAPNIVLLNGEAGYVEAELLFEIFKIIKISEFEIKNARVLKSGEGRIVSYQLLQTGTIQGHPLPEDTFCSTVWHNQGGRWLASFHQETANQTSNHAVSQ